MSERSDKRHLAFPTSNSSAHRLLQHNPDAHNTEVDESTKPLRLIIVEDSHCYALRLRGRLAAIPEVEVVGAAESPALAIDLLQSTRPDVILLDLNLRHGSGTGVLRYIRQAGIDVRVIVMTSDPHTELRESCFSLGAHSFFDKFTLLQHLPAELDSFRGELLNG